MTQPPTPTASPPAAKSPESTNHGPVGDRVALVDLHDPTHVIDGVVRSIDRRRRRALVRHVTARARPFSPERYWEQWFDLTTGASLAVDGAFRVHAEDLPKLTRRPTP